MWYTFNVMIHNIMKTILYELVVKLVVLKLAYDYYLKKLIKFWTYILHREFWFWFWWVTPTKRDPA